MRYIAPLSDVWLTCWSLLDASVGTVLVSEGFSTLSDFASIQVSCATNGKTIREGSITRDFAPLVFFRAAFPKVYLLSLYVSAPLLSTVPNIPDDFGTHKYVRT